MVRNAVAIAGLIGFAVATPVPNPTFGKLFGEVPGLSSLINSFGGSSEVTSGIEGLTDLGVDALGSIAGAIGKKLPASGVGISGGVDTSGSGDATVSSSGSGSGSIGSYGSSGGESNLASTSCTSSVSAPTATSPSGYENPTSGDSSSKESGSSGSISSGTAGYGDDASAEDQPAGY
jgi:hypothetical protein